MKDSIPRAVILLELYVPPEHLTHLQLTNNSRRLISLLYVSIENAAQFDHLSMCINQSVLFLLSHKNPLPCLIVDTELNESQTFSLQKEAIDKLHTWSANLHLRLQSVGILSSSALDAYNEDHIGASDEERKLAMAQISMIRVQWVKDQKPLQDTIHSSPSEGDIESSLELWLPFSSALTSVSNTDEKHKSTQRLASTKLLWETALKISNNNDESLKKPWIVILRGIPGSGKSTLTNELVRISALHNWECTICSADKYFHTPRGYQFNASNLRKAHQQCQNLFASAVQRQQNDNHVVVVDNTNTEAWEYTKYLNICQSLGITNVTIAEMHCPDFGTAFAMAKRNSHGVSIAKVLEMWKRFTRDENAVLLKPVFAREEERVPSFLSQRLGYGAWTGLPDSQRPKVEFVGLFLTHADRRALLQAIQARHSRIIAEHVTLFYNPTREYVRQVEVGSMDTVCIVGECQDALGQALKVDLRPKSAQLLRKKNPHITFSLARGVSAVYSNNLLERSRRNSAPKVLSLQAQASTGLVIKMADQRHHYSSRDDIWTQSCEIECVNHAKDESLATCGWTIIVVYAYVPEEFETDSADCINQVACLQRLKQYLGSTCNSKRLLCVQSQNSPQKLSSPFNLTNRFPYHAMIQESTNSDAATAIFSSIQMLIDTANFINKISVIELGVQSAQWLSHELTDRYPRAIVQRIALPLFESTAGTMNSSSAITKFASKASDYRFLDLLDLFDIGISAFRVTQIAEMIKCMQDASITALKTLKAWNNSSAISVKRIDAFGTGLMSKEPVDLLLEIRSIASVAVMDLLLAISETLHKVHKQSHVFVSNEFLYTRQCAVEYPEMTHFRVLCHIIKGDTATDPISDLLHEWILREQFYSTQQNYILTKLSDDLDAHVLLVAFIYRLLLQRYRSYPDLFYKIWKTSSSVQTMLYVLTELLVSQFLSSRCSGDLGYFGGLLLIRQFWQFVHTNSKTYKLSLSSERLLKHFVQETLQQFLSAEADRFLSLWTFDAASFTTSVSLLYSILYADTEEETHTIEYSVYCDSICPRSMDNRLIQTALCDSITLTSKEDERSLLIFTPSSIMSQLDLYPQQMPKIKKDFKMFCNGAQAFRVTI